MNFTGLNLIINGADSSKQGLLQSFFSQVPANAGVTFRGDAVPVILRDVQQSASPSRFWDDIDITGAAIQIAIDDPDLPPTQGTFSLTYGANTTGPLAFNITAAALATALNALASITSAGGVTVVLDGLDYIITFTTNGARTLIAETDISLYPASLITIVRDQTGSTDVPEIQVVSVFQAPAAYQNSFIPLPGADYEVVSTQTGSGSVPSSQQISFDPAPYDGTFTVTTGLGTTTAVPYNVSQSALATALNAITGAAGRYSVSGSAGGPYTVTDSTGSNTAITVNVSGLVVAVGVSGSLALNTPPMRARFLGVTGNSIQLLLEVKVAFSGNPPATIFQGTVTVNKEVIRGSSGGYSPANPSAFLEFINNEFSITGFTGGAPLNVDGIATVIRSPGELHAANVGGKFYIWKLIAGAWPGGTSPSVIQPVDYNAGTNAKYWQLVSIFVPVMGASGASHAAGLVPDPGVTAGTTHFLREDGTWQTVTASPPPFVAKTANYTLAAGNKIAADSTGGVFNLSLYAGAATTDAPIEIIDPQGTHASNNVTLVPNGTDKINGVNASVALNVTGAHWLVVWVGGATGWRVI